MASRIIALDIGEKRVGVALSDPDRRVATPHAVWDAAPLLANGRDLVRLVEEYEVAEVVVGLPLTLEGTEGPQARRVRQVAERLAGFLRIPVRFVDERLTSREAAMRMREAGFSERRQRGMKDMVAAALILQAYLDAPMSGDGGDGS